METSSIIISILVAIYLFFDYKKSKSEHSKTYKQPEENLKAKKEFEDFVDSVNHNRAQKYYKRQKYKKSKKYTNKKNNLKNKGDEYERYIGKNFEKKGGLVIYNGLIKGYEDKGVDLIYINDKEIHLIQCKNWTKKILTKNHLEKIYEKLQNYDFDFLNLSPYEIKENLQISKEINEIKNYL